jgi:SagB-type dehydrogenase family enzyme
VVPVALRFAVRGGRGPAPSAGSLQAIELYLVVLAGAWLAPGVYHYDRAGHHLSRIAPVAARPRWTRHVPSLADAPRALLLSVLVGDAARVEAKYGARAFRLLLLKAGHVMQNLCLIATSLSPSTVPFGGFLESEVACRLALPPADAVLYVGACGVPEGGRRPPAGPPGPVPVRRVASAGAGTRQAHRP